MKCFLLTFRSVTFAQRAEGLLQDRRGRCTIQRTPRWMEEQGCGYALKLWTDDLDPVLRRLSQMGLGPRRIYELGENGAVAEVVR